MPRTRGRGARRHNAALESAGLPPTPQFAVKGAFMSESFHATTIVSVRRDGKVVIGGDGQVTLGNTVVKANARKLLNI